jgi:hypothetical protein
LNSIDHPILLPGSSIFDAIVEALLGGLAVIERPNQRPTIVRIDTRGAILGLVRLRQLVVPNDPVPQNSLFVRGHVALHSF